MFDYGNKDVATMLGYVFVLALPIWYLTTYLLSPLRRYPGPVLAGESTSILLKANLATEGASSILTCHILIGWTNLWRMLHVRQGKYHVVIHELHKKYGPVVRIGPNVLDLDIPELVKTIYNIKSEYLKVGLSLSLSYRGWLLVLIIACDRPSFTMAAVLKITAKSSTISSASAILNCMHSRSDPSRNITPWPGCFRWSPISMI